MEVPRAERAEWCAGERGGKKGKDGRRRVGSAYWGSAPAAAHYLLGTYIHDGTRPAVTVL